MYNISPYSKSKFVLRGNTKPFKKTLSKLKGRYNPNLKGGSGWLFKNEHRENIEKFICDNTPPKDPQNFLQNKILICGSLIPLFFIYLYFI